MTRVYTSITIMTIGYTVRKYLGFPFETRILYEAIAAYTNDNHKIIGGIHTTAKKLNAKPSDMKTAWDLKYLLPFEIPNLQK